MVCPYGPVALGLSQSRRLASVLHALSLDLLAPRCSLPRWRSAPTIACAWVVTCCCMVARVAAAARSSLHSGARARLGRPRVPASAQLMGWKKKKGSETRGASTITPSAWHHTRAPLKRPREGLRGVLETGIIAADQDPAKHGRRVPLWGLQRQTGG